MATTAGNESAIVCHIQGSTDLGEERYEEGLLDRCVPNGRR